MILKVFTLIHQIELVSIKNTGHWVHVNAPEELACAVLDFLSF